MSIGTSTSTEFDAFSIYVKELIDGGEKDFQLEDAVVRFRAYQHDLERLKEKLRPSIEQADRGEARELDFEALLSRVHARLEKQGIKE